MADSFKVIEVEGKKVLEITSENVIRIPMKKLEAQKAEIDNLLSKFD